jgi:hypothetical protein
MSHLNFIDMQLLAEMDRVQVTKLVRLFVITGLYRTYLQLRVCCVAADAIGISSCRSNPLTLNT